jgi:hypothetical protein
MRFGRSLFAALGGVVSLALAAAPAARAIPPPEPPYGRPTAGPTSTPFEGEVLPVGSPLLFVLDDKISSASTPAGSVIKMHLKDPLVVNGSTVAPAGTPGTFTVIATRKSASGDQDGAIQVHFAPLDLGDGRTLPIRADHEYLTIERTGGQLATRGTVDTLSDIFVPYYVLYQIFRKGQQMVLPRGAVLRAETAASVDASDPKAVAIRTPAPFTLGNDPVHADYTPVPLFTYVPTPPPKKKPTPSPKPTATPSDVPTGPVTEAPGTSAPSSAPSMTATGSPATESPAPLSS